MNRVYYVLIYSKFGIILDRQVVMHDYGLNEFLGEIKEEMSMRNEIYIVSKNLPEVYLDNKNGIFEYKKG